MNERYIELVAEAAHEANRAFAQTIGQLMPPWNSAPMEMRSSVIEGVRGMLKGDTPEQSHERWVAGKVADGWTYGPTKDAFTKTHPCLLPYAELSAQDRYKDHVFLTVATVVADGIQLYGMKFKGGDVVQHKDGGPKMTVDVHQLADDVVKVVFFDADQNCHRGGYRAADLVHA